MSAPPVAAGHPRAHPSYEWDRPIRTPRSKDIARARTPGQRDEPAPTPVAGSGVGASGDGDGEPPARRSHGTLHRALPKRRRAVVGELLPGCRLGDALSGAPVVPDRGARGTTLGRWPDRGSGGGRGIGDEGGVGT